MKQQEDIEEFLKNKSPKEHYEILRWIAYHYYPKDSNVIIQAVANIVRDNMRGDKE